ncbi:MAG TPA: LysR family transcriptional regulator [Streptosporangiaceae bacterium]|nr:LysR family transcriptional regulator [Streptosporangiaceae bacterium]
MQVELRDIRVFVTTAEELHFGRAADRLHLTTSRVSQVLRSLELQLGCRLLDRTSRSVSLTPLGQQLLERLRPACDELDQALADTKLAASGIAGTLRLGQYLPLNGGPHLAGIVEIFERRHPACRVEVLDIGLNRPELDWLRKGDVAVLATRLPISDPDITVGPVLSAEPRVVVVGREHPLAGRHQVSIDDLAGYPACTVATARRELADALVPPRTPCGRELRRVTVRSTGEALMRVALGEAVYLTVRPFLDYVSHSAVVTVPVEDLPPSQTALIWLTASHASSIRAFARAASDVATARAPAH